MTVKHNSGSGNWNDNTTWSPAGVPNASDTVQLDYSRSATVTLSGNGAAVGTEISNQQTLALVSGNLGGSIRILDGGTLQAASGANTTGGSILLRDGGSHLNIENNATLRIGTDTGVIKNAGEIRLGSAGGPTQLLFGTRLSFTSDLNVNSGSYQYQGGKVTLSDSDGNIITTGGDRGYIFNTNNTIQGAGQLGAGKASITNSAAVGNGSKTNDHAQGVIKATGTNNALVIDTGPGGSLANGGLIQAEGKAGLVIGNASPDAATVKNTGTIEAGAGSKVVLAHANVTGTDGTIRTTGAGAELDLQDTTITGGTISTVAGSTLAATGRNFLTNVSFASGGMLTMGDGVLLVLKGGTASIAGLKLEWQLSFDNALTLQGGATASIGGDGYLSGTSTATLTNVDDTLSGTGLVTAGSFSNQSGGKVDGLGFQVGTLSNAGLIGGRTLITAKSVTNSGTMSHTFIKAEKVTNDGIILDTAFILPYGDNLVNGKTGVITNGSLRYTIVKNQGLMQADGAGETLLLEGAEVQGGKLSTSNGGIIEVAAFTDHATSLDPDEIASGTQFLIDNGAYALLGNTSFTPMVLDNVSISLAGADTATTLNMSGGELVLQGGGKITLSDSASNKLQLPQFTNANGVISGAGRIEATTMDNQAGGSIIANGTNALTVNVNTLKNNGTLEADGSTLKIVSANTIQGGGSVRVTDGGTVDLSGAAGYLGSLVYAGIGTIEGSLVAPAGTIYGFATGDEFIFGKQASFGAPLMTSWRENPEETGGTLTIKTSPTETYATLQFSGIYDNSDFTASQVSLSDGTHIAVSFTGALRWGQAVSGNWQTAVNWYPTKLAVPGADDNALITVAGAAYTVTVSQDTTVKSLATGVNATVDITGSTLSVTAGTASVANAGTIVAEAGAAFAVGGTFVQDPTGRIAAAGLDALIDIDKGGTISGGQIRTDIGGVLNAAGGTATLLSLGVSNDGSILVDGNTILTLTGTEVTGTGDIDVAQGSTLALAGSTISGNTIELAGKLQINANTTLDSAIDLSAGAIVSGGAAATFHNASVIEGYGTIGDQNLTLVNDGSIIAATGNDGNLISLGTGAHKIVNNGFIFALAGAEVSVTSALDNTQEIHASGGSVLFDNAVTNSGVISANDGTSVLTFGHTLGNTGSVSAGNGGLIDIWGQVTQQAGGELLAAGDGAVLNLRNGSSVSGGQVALTGLADLKVQPGGMATLTGVGVSLDTDSALDVSNAILTLVDTRVTGVGAALAKVAGTSALLALKGNTTLHGATYLIQGAAVQVSGTDVLLDETTTLQLEPGAKLASDGNAATLTNAGLIRGASSVIGDINLTLHNEGTIAPLFANDSLSIDTGSNAVVNDGTLTASATGALLSIASTVQNNASGKLQSGKGTLRTVGVENAGLVSATAGGYVQINGALNNAGLVSVATGGLLQALALDNSAKLLSTGAGSTLVAGNGSAAVTNSGQIVAADHGAVVIDGGLANLSGGQLLAQASGQITVFGAATGGIATLTGGGMVDFEGSTGTTTTTNAIFQGDTSELLMLNNSTRFAGTVTGMGTGDSIDIKDIDYAPGESFYDPTKGQLDVSDGTTVIKIQLIGSYAADQFTFSSDGRGGTVATQATSTALTLVGDNSDNLLIGGNASDFLYGRGGNDSLIGGLGTDYLYGEAGDDVLLGGAAGPGGANQLWGGEGNDTASYAGTTGVVYVDLGGEAGYVDGVLTDQYNSIENLIGGAGSNTLVGDDGNNQLKAGGADDYLYGMAGDDILIGGDSLPGRTNQLWGGPGTDTASYVGTAERVYASISEHGGWIADVLVDEYNSIENLTGGSGNDTLVGDAGANVLNGGAGGDALWGEGGADSFVYTTYSDSNLVSGYDTIADFVSGTSKLDLTALHTDAAHIAIVSSLVSASTSLYVEQTPGTFNAATDLAISFVGANAIQMSDIKFA